MPLPEGLDADAVLEKIIIFVAPRRTRVREFFLDFDKLRSNQVSKTQFARALNIVGIRLSHTEVDVIAQRFAEPGQTIPDFKVNYDRFCKIVEGLTEDRRPGVDHEPQAFPRSDFIARVSQTDWSHNSLSPVKKLQSKVVEKRLRLYNHFQDFDALRKGFCTCGQVKTVFTILGLDKELGHDDFKSLLDCYSRADGMFCYTDFCADIDLAFTKPNLLKDPMIATMPQLKMPDASSTSPARRNRQALSAEAVQKVFDLEEKIRARVKFRRCLLRSAFQDMDRTKRGHVSRSQFARVMGMLGFELAVADIDALSLVYCDMGNVTEFNYVDFCTSCDPKSELSDSSNATLPREEASPKTPKYFDAFGQVHRYPHSVPTTPRLQAVAQA